ncbi:MAG: GPR endopeptidase [Ruminococcaceae bacterium]|nr:GPR endopeptidase [Oscillospiraceae bacterium]
MHNYMRTDLACEAPIPPEKRGIHLTEYSRSGIRIEEMQVQEGEGEKSIGRPAGRYVTLHCGKIWEMDQDALACTAEAAAEILLSFLTDCIGSPPGTESGIFVAGLGNRFITADSIGPRTADLVTVTNHASGEDSLLSRLGCCRVSALAPGVLGQTGLEAARLIAEAASAAHADAIIAVDALAARSTERLGTTVQISDTGIRPGSGIGNHRAAITGDSMGIPVIAMGIPTVVDSATLVWDALANAGITEADDTLTQVLENGRKYIVSPRESDLIAASAAELLGGTLNRVLTPALL